MTLPALKAIAIGVGGSLILALFCLTFLALDKILFILPVFIGFNGTITGYKLVEMLKTRIMNISVFSLVLGVGAGALTFVAVTLALRFAGPIMGNIYSLNMYDLFVYMGVSGLTSYLGAKLAVRYFNL